VKPQLHATFTDKLTGKPVEIYLDGTYKRGKGRVLMDGQEIAQLYREKLLKDEVSRRWCESHRCALIEASSRHCPERRYRPHLHGGARLRYGSVRARRVVEHPRSGHMGDQLLSAWPRRGSPGLESFRVVFLDSS